MELTLEHITGVIGEWLDGDIAPEVPMAVIKSLEIAYNLSAAKLEETR